MARPSGRCRAPDLPFLRIWYMDNDGSEDAVFWAMRSITSSRESRMKKVLSLVLAAGLLLAASLAHADTKRLTLATGGTSGVYFPLGGAIAQVITNKSNGAISVTAQATGASGENMRLVQAGDVDFAMVQNDVADSAFNGLAPFRSKLDNVRVIGRLYPEYLHVVASKDSGVKSLEDFKGKKVSVGARGSGNEVNCRQIFGFYGLDYKNIEPIFLPYGETADQFKDRQVDGFVSPSVRPTPPSRTSPPPRKWSSCPCPARRSTRSSRSSPTW